MSKVCVLPFTFNVTLLITDLLTRMVIRASSLVQIPVMATDFADFTDEGSYTGGVIRTFKFAGYFLLPFCLGTANGQSAQREPWPREAEQPDIAKPKDVPRPWRELIGEYGPENETMYALENAGYLSVIFTNGDPEKLDELKANAFKFS